MPKPKAPPKDYDADIRIELYPDESMTKKELHGRANRFVKQCLFGDDAPPREPQKAK